MAAPADRNKRVELSRATGFNGSMIIEQDGKTPSIDPAASVASTASIIGDVQIGPHTRVLHGAVITAESGPVRVGATCIIMENAVIRGVKRHPVTIGDHCLIGPHAHLSGCTLQDRVFAATGSSVFNGAVLEEDSCVRINGVVHVDSRLEAGVLMPIGWIAIGDPAEVLPPESNLRINAALQRAGFSETVFGTSGDRAETMITLTERYSRALAGARGPS